MHQAILSAQAILKPDDQAIVQDVEKVCEYKLKQAFIESLQADSEEK